jgi:hypothetical protein
MVQYNSSESYVGSGIPNTLKLYKIINGTYTEIGTKAIHSDQNEHIITFSKDVNNLIKVKLDDLVKIKTVNNGITNSTQIKLESGGNVESTAWFGSVEYTPITNVQSEIKTLLDIPYYSDLKTNLCIKPLKYDLKTLLSITYGNKSNDLKTLLTINSKYTNFGNNDLKTILTINPGAVATDLTTYLMIGILYEKRLPITGKILYTPRVEPPPINPPNPDPDPDPNPIPTPKKYPDDYGTPTSTSENNGISIIIGGVVYV